MWGVLPMRSLLDPDNMRWSLGSADICFEHGLVAMTAWNLDNLDNFAHVV
jgi:hypothetical protein